MPVVDFQWCMWVYAGDGCGFVPMVGLFDLVDVRCWMWVCASDGCGFMLIFLDVFFFFF